MEERDVIAIHDRLLVFRGGAAGLRDQGELQSALARRAYAKTPDIIERAALYTSGIVRNHAFVDGNKRAGFVVGVLFLELNRFAFRAAEAGATQAVLALAAGKMEEAAYTGWLRANSKQKRGR